LGGDDRHCSIVVKDTGIGMSPEFLPYIFERFGLAIAIDWIDTGRETNPDVR